ncbi:Uncharacterised protein [Chryseobacterium carnipullorum]|uniref:Uncharacterized protein n=1 Tax=Chryseobacterium carnipullorum TaxID=1124835 RepID=A0A376EAI1_CHRCU|nr:hypothetical protein [Chryseobacterium carnipullorum]STD05206.1 Uncharacterised protein [Chryseobacterium carnipullorum]
MEKFKIWLRKNWSTALLVSIFIVLLVSPDAKAWLMRQIISTGLMNSKIEEKETEPAVESTPLSSTENFSVRNDKGEIINTSDSREKWYLLTSGRPGARLAVRNSLRFRHSTSDLNPIKILFFLQSIWMSRPPWVRCILKKNNSLFRF